MFKVSGSYLVSFSCSPPSIDQFSCLNWCRIFKSIMKHVNNNHIENWTSLYLVMVIESTCFVDSLIEYVGIPNCVYYRMSSTSSIKFEDIVQSLSNMCF